MPRALSHLKGKNMATHFISVPNCDNRYLFAQPGKQIYSSFTHFPVSFMFCKGGCIGKKFGQISCGLAPITSAFPLFWKQLYNSHQVFEHLGLSIQKMNLQNMCFGSRQTIQKGGVAWNIRISPFLNFLNWFHSSQVFVFYSKSKMQFSCYLKD